MAARVRVEHGDIARLAVHVQPMSDQPATRQTIDPTHGRPSVPALSTGAADLLLEGIACPVPEEVRSAGREASEKLFTLVVRLRPRFVEGAFRRDCRGRDRRRLPRVSGRFLKVHPAQ